MVFQSYAIWPHMSVFQNAAFPLQVGKKKYSRREIEERVHRVLKVVALDELADREATKLSGGQQQRLALARALVMEPALLLLDEPLSNLDAKLRERMRFELKRLQRDLGITTVYVTHDQSEALALSHSVAVMNAGRIEQIGSPREVYETPRNQFVADFIGSTNFVSGSVGGPDAEAGFYVIRSELGELKARGLDTLVQGEQVVLSIRPEDIELTEAKPQGANVYQGTVDQKVFLGETVDFQVRLGSRALQSRAHPSLRTPVGHAIFVRIDPEKCVALKASGEWARP
jgi:iron(III) transport system ATP-binding protein